MKKLWDRIGGAIGIIMTMVGKTDKKKDTGKILLGFAVLMFGMDTMSGAVSGLKNDPSFSSHVLVGTTMSEISVVLFLQGAKLMILDIICLIHLKKKNY